MGQSFCNLVYHIVFSTKSHTPWLEPSIRNRVFGYIGGIIKTEKGIPLAINGTKDHVHILVKLRQDRAVSDFVRVVKSKTSLWFNNTITIRGKFAWQKGYGSFTASTSQIPRVKGYILNQEKHHQKRTFKEEFVALLRAHGIAFDEKYLWVE